MSQTATNVLMMPKPSDKNSTTPEKSLLPGGRGDATAEKVPVAVPNEPSTEVFAVFGVEPEIQAYAMAKYSRSALSMKESLREISSQKAEKFLNTF